MCAPQEGQREGCVLEVPLCGGQFLRGTERVRESVRSPQEGQREGRVLEIPPRGGEFLHVKRQTRLLSTVTEKATVGDFY